MRWIAMILVGALSGCFAGNYQVKKDEFSGQVVRDARIGMASAFTATAVIHAHRQGDKSSIDVYLINTGLAFAKQVWFIADAGKFGIQCNIVGRRTKGLATTNMSRCPLTSKQASAIGSTSSLRFRVGGLNGLTGRSTKAQLRYAAKVFSG